MKDKMRRIVMLWSNICGINKTMLQDGKILIIDKKKKSESRVYEG